MSATVQKLSVVSQYIDKAPLERTGQINPIELPSVDIRTIGHTFGPRLTHGNIGTIHQVKECSPPRLYKIIPQDQFKNGDEIRISKILGDAGIAPHYYSAFLAKQRDSTFVVIEMDEAGKSLGKWMEDLADQDEVETEEQAFQKLVAKIQEEESGSGFHVVKIKEKKRLHLEDAVEKLYGSKEPFYYALFSRIKSCAEKGISYGDSHVGNLMPNIGTDKGFQIIDFDAAELLNDPKLAATQSISSLYNRLHFNNFQKIPNLSKESKELIHWFEDQSK